MLEGSQLVSPREGSGKLRLRVWTVSPGRRQVCQVHSRRLPCTWFSPPRLSALTRCPSQEGRAADPAFTVARVPVLERGEEPPSCCSLACSVNTSVLRVFPAPGA